MLQIHASKQLGQFSLDIHVNGEPRGVTALFGRSGCGKSSTINMIAGLLRPDSGRIQLGDDTLFDTAQGVNVPSEQRRIGYVFQDARLFPHYSVLGNLRYGLTRNHRHTHSHTRSPRIQLDAIIDLLGLQPLLNRQPRLLSGGEKQRVALGRALLSQPRLLLLDEPLASLDQARRNEVLPYLERVRDELGIPMIYVSHQFDEVLQLATHLVLMDHGRVTAQGSPEQLSHHPALGELLGADAMGTVIDSHVSAINTTHGLASVPVGHGQLQVDANTLVTGQQVRLRLLARDLILATQDPVGLSVRNRLSGTIVSLRDDFPHAANAHVAMVTSGMAHSVLVSVDVGNVVLLARITRHACQELSLTVGMAVRVLVKAVTLRGQIYHRPDPTAAMPS